MLRLSASVVRSCALLRLMWPCAWLAWGECAETRPGAGARPAARRGPGRRGGRCTWDETQRKLGHASLVPHARPSLKNRSTYGHLHNSVLQQKLTHTLATGASIWVRWRGWGPHARTPPHAHRATFCPIQMQRRVHAQTTDRWRWPMGSRSSPRPFMCCHIFFCSAQARSISPASLSPSRR